MSHNLRTSAVSTGYSPQASDDGALEKAESFKHNAKVQLQDGHDVSRSESARQSQNPVAEDFDLFSDSIVTKDTHQPLNRWHIW